MSFVNDGIVKSRNVPHLRYLMSHLQKCLIVSHKTKVINKNSVFVFEDKLFSQPN